MRPQRLSRRDMLKLGLVGSGYVILGPDGRILRADDLPPSPPTTPFRDPLPLPPEPVQEDPFLDFPDDYKQPNAPFVGEETTFFKIIAEQRFSRFHSELPETSIWGYRPNRVQELVNGIPTLVDAKGKWPFVLGPTFTERRGADTLVGGGGLLVRHVNDLPEDQPGFGTTRLSVHLHGGHHPARADGCPENINFPAFPIRS